MCSVRDFGTDRLLWTFIVTEKSFHIFSRPNFLRVACACVCVCVRARIHFPGPNAGRRGRTDHYGREQVHLRACGRAASCQYRFNLSVEQHTATEELLPCFQTCVNRWQVQACVYRKGCVEE
jgi:hypothetical protein